MKLLWDKWLYGIGSAAIGGGAGAAVSGFANIMIAPQTFNLTTGAGAWRVLAAMGINFAVMGAFSMFFYLKQSPLPALDEHDTAFFRKTVERAVDVEKQREASATPAPGKSDKPSTSG